MKTYVLLLLAFFSIAMPVLADPTAPEPKPAPDAQIPLLSPSPDNSLIVRYIRGDMNPNAGQMGKLYIVSQKAPMVPLICLEEHTVGIRSADVHWSPDSKAVVILEHYGRAGTVLVAETTPAGWVVHRNPSAKLELKELGDKVQQVHGEQVSFLSWTGNSQVNLMVSQVYRDGAKAAFTYTIVLPGALTEGWKQVP